MKRILLTVLSIMLFSACSTEVIPTATPLPVIVVDEILFEQIVNDGRAYTSKDFFDVGFKEYKEYNVSKLTGATEAWYGYWGENEDSVKYYELRLYPDHSTAISDGTPFAKDATGEDANLGRKDAMWRVGLAERKISGNFHARSGNKKILEEKVTAKYADYMIFNNVIMLCEGEDSKEAFKLCNDLIDLVSR